MNYLNAIEPLRGDSLLLIDKYAGVTNTHLVYLRRIKDQYILSYFYNPLAIQLSPEILTKFFLKLYMSICHHGWGKFWNFWCSD